VTPVRISIAAAVGSVILILIVLELIRGRRLKERYALLWLVTGLVLLVLSAWRGGLNTIAGWLGVSGYPPAILFAAAIMFVIAVLLHYSTVLSKLTDDNVLLAQEVALLRTRIDALEGAATPDVSPTPVEPRAG
jgi:cell division protein FtsW (lipid II flippase)